MRKLLVIGIGTGNLEHMTIQAINCLNSADVVLVPRKGDGKEDLIDLRREICHRYLTNRTTKIIEFDLPVRDTAAPNYGDGVRKWHETVAETYRDLLSKHSGETSRIAFLVWGDPSLYDSTLRIVDELRTHGLALDTEVVPGISSFQALAASHGIVLNTIGNSVHVTTGRRLKEGFPENADSALIMLDGDCAFRSLPGDAFDIFWGAYLGTEDEIIVAGKLSEVAERIEKAREEARQRKGWIMDTYLLRRR